MNWEAIRGEYLAGGIGQRALAEKHGVRPGELSRRAREEGWVALRRSAEARDAAAKKGAADAAAEDAMEAENAREAEAVNDGADGNARIAVRVRKTLLLKLEQAADSLPSDATELKTQEDSTVKLLKLRDLTAAYKELVGDLPREGEGEACRVVVDV